MTINSAKRAIRTFRNFFIISPAFIVIELDQGSVDGGLVHDRLHKGVHVVPHLAAGDGGGVHQVLTHLAHPYPALPRALFKEAVYRAHALAGYLVEHDYHVGVVLLVLLPEVVEHDLIAALGVGAHGRGLVHLCDTRQHGLAGGGVDDIHAVEVDHLAYAVDTPALEYPVVEVRVVVRGSVPDDGAVLDGLGEFTGRDLLFKQGIDLAVVIKRLLHAADRLMLEYAVEPRGGAGVRRKLRAVQLPFLKLAAGLLVPYLAGFLQLVPVILRAGMLLKELDGGEKFVDGVFLYLIAEPPQRDVDRLGRESVAAVLDGRGHNAAVAGHIAAEHAAADLRIVVLDGDARLEGRQGTHVRRQTVQLGLLDVVYGAVLVYERGQIHGQHLIEHNVVVGKAAADELRDKLVHADDLFAQFLGLFAAGMEIEVGVENGVKLLRDDLGEIREVIPSGPERRAAKPLAVAVEEGGNGEIGEHPAVAEDGLDVLYGVSRRPFDELSPQSAPLGVVICRILQPAPLAVLVYRSFREEIFAEAAHLPSPSFP